MPSGKFADVTKFIGHRFGKLLVLEHAGTKTSGTVKRALWKCKCDCGDISYVTSNGLTTGNSKSCGCQQIKRKSDSPKWTGYQEISGSYWSKNITSAAVRNLTFCLDIREAWDLFIKQGKKCRFTGVELNFHTKSKTASLDRIDSSKGYLLDNVQWIHTALQVMKGNKTDEDFIEICREVASRNKYLRTKFALEKQSKNHGHNWRGYEDISGAYFRSVELKADKRDLPFDITIEEIWQLYLDQNRRCALSGKPLIFSTRKNKSGIKQTASLDRIDSSLGYVPGNIQWVHKKFQFMKTDMQNDDFIYWCEKVAKYCK